MKKQIQTKNKMLQLEALFKQITECAVDAGRLIVEMVREDPANYDRIKNKFSLSDHVMERFQNLGLGRISPRLVMNSSPAAPFLEKLPIELQEKVLDNGVSVVRNVEGDKTQSEIVPFSDLTFREAQQVFDGNSLRSVETQAERLKEKLIVLPPKPSYEMVGDVVVFHDARFTVPQLEELVNRIKSTQMLTLESSIKAKQVG